MDNVDISISETTWQRACLVALSSLQAMGPARLSALLQDMSPDAAWSTVVERGSLSPSFVKSCGSNAVTMMRAWSRVAKRTDPIEVLERYESQGVGVWTQFDEEYPADLENDPYPPAALFWQGHPQALHYPRVAIVGTRHCTPDGRQIARRFATELSERGVSVVSGLALGIDGAAHVGALEALRGAPPIAVVGSGLDVVYPKRHAKLWSEVRDSGLLISEAPLGAIPEPWRFPARNRIIAALADVVVVIESHERGGSLLTAEEAVARNRPVLAVPGSISSPASRGTNMLLASGCPVVTCVDDILCELPLESRPETLIDLGVLPENPAEIEVLDAIDWQPTSTDDVLVRTGMDPIDVTVALSRLEQGGWIFETDGWWQRTASQDSASG